MRKILTILIILFMFINMKSDVYAAPKTYSDCSHALDFKAFEKMIRADCIVYIMKAVGAEGYIKHTGVKSREYRLINESVARQNDLYKFNLRALKTSMYDINYLDVAINLDTQIIYGKSMENDVIYVDGLSYATVEEVLAFMIRFLKNEENSDLSDLNEILRIAEEKNLISEDDYFYYNMKSEITVSTFKLLLKRFVQQPRYLFFQKTEEDLDFYTDEDFEYDYLGSISYLEYLNMLNLSDEHLDFSCYEYITNNDAISYIMKAIGTPEDVLKERREAPVNYWQIMWKNENIAERVLEFREKCYFDFGTDYVEIAIVNTNIVNGKYYNPPGMPDYFDVVKYASAREVISYMMRCLYGNFDIDLTDSEFLFEKAKEISLVCAEDSFYDNCEKLLTIVEFQKIMERFLSQPVNLYYDGTDFDFLA